MDLQNILEKNKHKVLKLAPFKMPAPPSIAVEDRPYNDIDLNVNRKTHKKLVTNGKQTGSKQVADDFETGSKQVANRYQTGSKQVADDFETGSRTGSKTGSKQVAEQVAAEDKKNTFSTLVGIQYKLVLFFYFLTKKMGTNSTGSITMDYLSSSLKSSKNNIKNAIIRLQNKQCILRNSGKTGRGGWTAYALSNVLYKELMQQDTLGYLQDETGSKQVAEQVAKQVAEQVARSSSSSSYINTTTKISVHTAREELPGPWQTVDYSVLAHIDFNVDHLMQLFQRGTLEPEVVQDSLYHFAFDLRHNKKREAIKGDPLNYLMGVLAKRPYTAPANYVDPNVEAFRRYSEYKAKQDEQLKALEANLQHSEFQSWYEHLPQSELDALCATMGEQSGLPEGLRQTIRMRHLREHFNDFVWPEVRRRLITTQIS